MASAVESQQLPNLRGHSHTVFQGSSEISGYEYYTLIWNKKNFYKKQRRCKI